MSDERWCAITGYEGYYDVSDQGRVHRRERATGAAHGSTRVLKPRLMKPTPLDTGHLSVEFRTNNKRRRFLVHRLVLMAFNGPAPEGTEGCHRNGDPTDNRIENLYWGTRSENVRDTIAHGRHPWASRTECGRGHKFTPENTRPRASGAGRECLACVQIWADLKHEKAKEARRRLRESRAVSVSGVVA